MLNGKDRRNWLVAGTGAAVIAAAVAGCDGYSASLQERDANRTGLTQNAAKDLPPAWFDGRLPILQFQKDPGRNRGWVLTPAGVYVVDFKLRRTVVHVPLPDWHWAGVPYGCMPTLALGPKGEALVSSDVLPTLWRIDPATLAVSRHELRLDADSGMDVGFSGLAYSAQQGTYVAVACSHGSLWRVDPLLAGARRIKAGYD
jgi:hypothetical protein